MQYSSYHDLIIEEFDRRKELNNSYSLRAFARDLGLSAPRLSQILNRKQGLSVDAAEGLVQKLRLTKAQKDWFLLMVGSLHARSTKQRGEFLRNCQVLRLFSF